MYERLSRGRFLGSGYPWTSPRPRNILHSPHSGGSSYLRASAARFTAMISRRNPLSMTLEIVRGVELYKMSYARQSPRIASQSGPSHAIDSLPQSPLLNSGESNQRPSQRIEHERLPDQSYLLEGARDIKLRLYYMHQVRGSLYSTNHQMVLRNTTCLQKEWSQNQHPRMLNRKSTIL